MTNLKDTWEKLKQLPNGEKVGLRMAQIQDFALVPENEGYALSASQVIKTIALWEEKLLHRTRLETIQGSVLDEFIQSMKESTHEEWATFKRETDLISLKSIDAERILIDSSGLVRNAGFEAWVLGEVDSPINSEAHDTKARLMGKKES